MKISTFKTFSRIISAFILLTISCQSPTPVNNDLTFLKTKGQYMVNEMGDTVLLQSIGLGNWLLPEGYMWKFGNNGDRPRKIEKVVSDLIGEEQAKEFWTAFRLNYITEADIIRIKELGFNAVRPALNARLFLSEEEKPQFIEEGFMLLANLINWCKKHQLYVIIDMHGAPGGQTGQNIDDSLNDLPELFMEEKYQDALVKLWLEIVRIYKDEPTVAAYDLLNEPLPERTGAAQQYGHLLEPLYKRLTTEIRKIDAKHMITLEGMNWSNNWSMFHEPFDNNTFYQFHYYCWNNPDNLNDISYFLKKRDTLNTPIWVGETGEKANTIYWGTTQYFEKNNIGWSFWPWKKMATKNTPYSINKPSNWDSIANYTREGAKPSKALAEQAFTELLENIKIENCEYYEDVTNAIFRRVPIKIEAENYLHGTYNETYFIKDTSKKSSLYRTNEFVPINLLSVDSTSHGWKWFTEQYITLAEEEWVKYQVNSDKIIKCIATLKAKSPMGSSVKIQLNGSDYMLEINSEDWQEYKIEDVNLSKGVNTMTINITKNSAYIDWINIE
ncbi:MAG: cellulase family glycosylhydrolase [Salinivirgaceae bacterium]|jgi:endoglucanase|nr:cellulase family glycosylhydrolase [Salinivirgaceae bacterium]